MTHNEAMDRTRQVWGSGLPLLIILRPDGGWDVGMGKPGEPSFMWHRLDPNGHTDCHEACKERELRPMREFDGCPICLAWSGKGRPIEDIMAERFTAKELANMLIESMSEPHMKLCDLLGLNHQHPNIW